MTAGRGRVIKSGSIAASAARVPWEPRPPIEEPAATEVEVVREQGVVVGIRLQCRCGRAHELELVAAPPEGQGRVEVPGGGR